MNLQRFTLYVIIAIMLISPFMLIVWTRSELTNLGYRMPEVVRDIEKLREENIRLKKKLYHLLSPERLRAYAEKHGFKNAEAERIIVIVE